MKRSLIVFLTTACASLALTTAALAWDGQREGFILGVGAGPGITSFTQDLTFLGVTATSKRETKGAFATDFKIGWAPTNIWQIYWTSQVSWFSMHNALDKNVTISTGVAGVGTSYYFKPAAPAPYLRGSIGYSGWSAPFEENSSSWTGFGISAGAGYEFAKYWSVEGNLLWGNPSKSENGVDATAHPVSFKVTLNILGY